MDLDMTITERKMTVRILGELDHHAARCMIRRIEEFIDAHLPRDCVLDMAGLTFMDSSGIAVILRTQKRMNEIGGRTWVENVPPQPMRVLDASGIDRIIRITSQN